MENRVALIIGGGGDPLAEYVAALKLCAAAEKQWVVFACNDMIEDFPNHIDHAVTLHPEKLGIWLPRRAAKGLPPPGDVWAHTMYSGVNQWTRDWLGSVGLFGVKLAREEGFTKIIGCGVHMTMEGNHYRRPTKEWDAALGFQRGWRGHHREIAPFFRSAFGWTRDTYGAPDLAWLLANTPDPHPLSKSRRNYGTRA
jgi:hypothetical protein